MYLNNNIYRDIFFHAIKLLNVGINICEFMPLYRKRVSFKMSKYFFTKSNLFNFSAVLFIFLLKIPFNRKKPPAAFRVT